MDLDLKGTLEFFEHKPLDIIRHRGRYMSDTEARTVVNYGTENGMEMLSDIPDEVADAVVADDPAYRKYAPEYIRYVSVDHVAEVLKSVLSKEDGYPDDLADDIISQL